MVRLVLWTHISLLMEEIPSVPFLYQNIGMCRFMAWFETYACLCNALCLLFMGILYKLYLIGDPRNMLGAVDRWGGCIIFIFPVITLLPFTTNSFGSATDGWCFLSGNSTLDLIWVWAILVGWNVLAVCTCLNLFLYILCTLARTENVDLMIDYLRTIGLYITVTFFSWALRAGYRIGEIFGIYSLESPFWIYYPIVLSGIMFCILFLVERKRLLQFDASNTDIGHESFSTAILRLSTFSTATNPMAYIDSNPSSRSVSVADMVGSSRTPSLSSYVDRNTNNTAASAGAMDTDDTSNVL